MGVSWAPRSGRVSGNDRRKLSGTGAIEFDDGEADRKLVAVMEESCCLVL